MTNHQSQSNFTIKHLSTLNEIKDETFLIFQSIQNFIPLKLQRKIKNDEKLQKFIILEICDEKLQNEVNEQFSQWKQKQKNNSKMRQRDKDQTYQNIIYNVLISELKTKGNEIESFEMKKSEKVVSRRRISNFNGMSQEETRSIGERMNGIIVKELRIENGMKKKECVKIINRFNCLNILNNSDESMNFVNSNEINEMNNFNEYESYQNKQNNQIYQIYQKEQKEMNEDTIPSDENNQNIQMNQNQMNYIQLPIQTIQTQNGLMNSITINNENYYCQLNYDQFGNTIPIIPMQDENGNVFYQSVVFDVASYQFVFVPYDGNNYVTVPVIQNNSNDGSYFN